MKKLCLLLAFALPLLASAQKKVAGIDELNAAAKVAKPGDVIILQNGTWNDVTISLNCEGTETRPITFRAETAGKVQVTGHSQLRLGGKFIVVDGLYFQNGYAGDGPVIEFRSSKDNLANNCRVTNCAIYEFNNPKRMKENNWILFYGKRNRLDHNTFIGKKNLGVLLAVILDDDRSRENFHSIDHNYFGPRIPLASNCGEIIRVGVSQHCEFNSNTQITDNFFDRCDGETEVVSIKSCRNVIRGNVLKECQGGVVLRHGHYNIVENNLFLGDDKPGTGGVRIINHGQWVINNLFYKCRGIDFRSPMSLMNGIPNSPAFRYVQVIDAVVANNSFYDCSKISFCEGSDTERTLPPANTILLNNTFYNNRDSAVYQSFDKTDGIRFINNQVSTKVQQPLYDGFSKAPFAIAAGSIVPVAAGKTLTKSPVFDSLNKIAIEKLHHPLNPAPGFHDAALVKKIEANAFTKTGAAWYAKLPVTKQAQPRLVKCNTTDEVYAQLETATPVIIQLTGTNYSFEKPLVISKQVEFKGGDFKFSSAEMPALFIINGNGLLQLTNVKIDAAAVKATNLIANDDGGSSNHYSLAIRKSIISNFNSEKGAVFFAHRYLIADSIILEKNIFENNNANLLSMADEKDNKGYYSAEKIRIVKNMITKNTGTLLSVYRGGNDESTMGPNLEISKNMIESCNTTGDTPLIELAGVQATTIHDNAFINSNTGKTLLLYRDWVRAHHYVGENVLKSSGGIITDKFVETGKNVIQ